jgi:ADP-heptose:LPS heptosyltransferase
VPYLHADPDAVAVWHEKLKDIPRPHIGLAWSSPLNQNAPARALSFDALRPLVDNFKPHLISLQLGDEAIQAAQAGIACPAIGDFADNAALIKVLDLVITLDSAPAHLAAALGTPTWILLPFHAEWRWLTARDDTPWYPSVRLFRQTRPMAWDDVVARVCEQIKTIMD